jgi:hypothetical protein|tara:strand:- start:803 stop:970 length:168 start_codon:yes stop_codon:yes gene_type:complete
LFLCPFSVPPEGFDLIIEAEIKPSRVKNIILATRIGVGCNKVSTRRNYSKKLFNH